MGFLSDDERAQLSPAEDLPHRFPIPTQIVSSDEYFPERQHGRTSGDAGCGNDALAKPLVAIQSQPTRRRSIPGDDVNLGMRKKFGGAKNLGVVELLQRLLRKRNFGHLEATEMNTDLGEASDDRGAHGLEHGIRRRCQHPKANTVVHGELQDFRCFAAPHGRWNETIVQ